MKIRVNSFEYDYRNSLDIYINNERHLSFYDGESEDNSLSRNFNDCYCIAEMMKLAYEAGKNGEELYIENTENDES